MFMGMEREFRPWPLAPLGLLTGAIPIAAAHLVLVASVALGYIEGCNPYLDGCTSISRAGRFGLANALFKALMLPYATVLTLYWFACAQWLRGLEPARSTATGWIPWLGFVSALFLVLYATFLGSDGDGYRLMRRYGVFVYFGFNFIAQLLLTGRLVALAPTPRVPAWIVRAKVTLCATVLSFGWVNVAAGAMLRDPDAVRNVMEWWAALLMACYYLLTWRAWRADGFSFAFRQ